MPNNSALIVTGDVTPDSVFSLAERMFGDWPRGADPFAADPIPPIPPLTEERRGDRRTTRGRCHGDAPVAGSERAPRIPTATYAADVFSDVLNQPESTLQKKLVDTGLWQSIGVNYYTLDHVGPITISGQTTPEKLEECTRRARMRRSSVSRNPATSRRTSSRRSRRNVL